MTAPVTTPAGMPLSEDAIADKVARLIARNGNDPQKAIDLLLEENQKYRRRHQSDVAKITELEKAPGLVKDAVVLTKEEAAVWTVVKDLKLMDAAALKQQLTEYPALAAYKKTTEDGKLWSEAATLTKYNPATLADLMASKGMTVEIKEVSVRDPNDAKKLTKERVAYVKKATGEAEPLRDYAERDLKHFLPALRMTDSEGEEGDADHTSTDGQQQGTVMQYPAHSASRGGTDRSKTNVVSSVLGGLYESPFPQDKTKKE